MELLSPALIVLIGFVLFCSFTLKKYYNNNQRIKSLFDVILVLYIVVTFFSSIISMEKEKNNETKERAQFVFDQNKAEAEVFSEQMKDYIKRLQSDLISLRSLDCKEVELMKEIEFVEVRDTLYVNGDTVITIKQEVKQCN